MLLEDLVLAAITCTIQPIPHEIIKETMNFLVGSKSTCVVSEEFSDWIPTDWPTSVVFWKNTNGRQNAIVESYVIDIRNDENWSIRDLNKLQRESLTKFVFITKTTKAETDNLSASLMKFGLCNALIISELNMYIIRQPDVLCGGPAQELVVDPGTNGQKCLVNASFMDFEPMMLFEKNRMAGWEGLIFQTAADYLKMDVNWINRHETMFPELLEDAAQGNSMAAMGGIYGFHFRFLRTEMIQSCFPVTLQFAAPLHAGPSKPTWFVILASELSPLSWSCTLATFVLYCIIAGFFKETTEDVAYRPFYVWALMLGKSEKTVYQRLFTFTIIFFGFMITIYYQAVLSSKLTAPAKPAEINNWKEMLDTNWSMQGTVLIKKMLQADADADPDNIVKQEMFKRHEPAGNSLEKSLLQMVQERNFFFGRYTSNILYVVQRDLLFHGVMRFYFHDSSYHVTTKCIRVASDATVNAVIETLIEKFRPDMRMLSVPEYALYVTHENGDERRLNAEEKPLLVQLNWAKDDREGRFLLKRIGDETAMPAHTFQESSFKRKLSKREKKQLKKQEKLKRVQSTEGEDAGKVSEKLYTELPETSFTRSISNPEAVMRRRRHQKLERKLQQFRSKDGGPDTGGTLKIYGEALCGDVPYKTLLLSVRDTAASVIREMLNKYGRDPQQEANNYCLVQTNSADGTEFILDEDECPLSILMNHPATSVRKGVIIGSIMFHVRRRPADYHPRKRKKKPQQRIDYRYEDSLPFFLEINPDGSELMSGSPRRHVLHPNVTEVGSERTGGPHLQLFGPNIQPRHCVIAHTDGLVTVTPCSRDAEVFVNGQRIFETSILQNGTVVKFGRIHNFRFVDPSADDPNRSRQHDVAFDRLSKEDTGSTGTGGPNGASNASNYETTFDVDGNVETVSLKDLDARSQRSIASSRDGNRASGNYDRYPRGSDPILPAVLEVREETEEAFLNTVILDLDHAQLTFKLAPTYVLYLMARYRASTHFRPELLPTERAHRLTAMLARVAQFIQHTIEERYTDPASLAFWMANAAELLHFLKCDRHISAFSLDAQDILGDAVQASFRHLVACLQCELAAGMANFLSDREEDDTILGSLCNAMGLLRLCRVNAALTIQLFSHLFHFINMLAFNKIVSSPSNPQGINYCTRVWGVRLKARVAQLAAWAERQGLELAASCHLGRLAEAAFLLEAPKYNVTDLAQVSSTCLKLNSIQLRALLRGYQPGPNEPRLSLELIDNVVRVAENVADELARSDGREVKLEETPELQLAFLLPEDGFSCDVVRGLHQGLVDFVQSLQAAGLCRMSVQHTSSGVWTIYMADPNMHLRSPSSMSNRLASGQPPPEVQTIRLHKSNNGMGLSIVAAKGAGQDRLGIYIKSVVAGGAADADGRLQAGDQLLKVDGHSLVGITQEKAAEYLVRTGPIVALEVAKQGAIYHGLATLLSQPSPLMARANANKARTNGFSDSVMPQRPAPQAPGPRRMSERDLPSRLGEEKRTLPTHLPIQSSKSVPSLLTGGAAGEHRPQEMFNPGYSRTSSSNSIPHAPQTPLAYRSNQNLSESRGHVTHGLHPAQSTPSLPQSHAMFNSTPNSGYQATPSSHHSFPSGPGSSYSHNDTQGSPSYNNSQTDGPHSPSADGERFYQNLSSYAGKAPPHNDLSPGYMRGADPSRDRERPASAYLPHYQHQQQLMQPGMHARSQSSRDMMRQEAKLQEMSEEVRRREMRGQNPPRGPLVLMSGRSPAPGPRGPDQLSPEGYRPHGPISPDGYRSQGPISPEGYRPQGPISSEGYRPQGPISPGQDVHRTSNDTRTGYPVGADGYPPNYRPGMQHHPEGLRDGRIPQDAYRNPPMSPGVSEAYREGSTRVPEDYRDSPPPPPPPVNTHPLMQKSLSPDSRYQASTGDAPRGGYYPTTTGDRRQYPYTGTNPWDREEKEKEQARRREAVRQWREQQVSELSAIANRTPQQDEQLRALKLDREFERRAEEAKQEDDDEGEEDGDEETESSERVQGLLKMAQAQNGPIIRPATGNIAQMKLDDIRNKHLNMKPTTPTKPNLTAVRDPNQLRIDQLTLNGPTNQPQQQYNQYNGYEKQNGGSPAAPERLSSYNAMQQLSPQQGSYPSPHYQAAGMHDRSYGQNQSQERSFATNQSINHDRSYTSNQAQSFNSNQSYQSQYNQDRNFNQAHNSYNSNLSQERSLNQSQGPMSPTRPNQLPGKRVSFSNAPATPTNQKLSPQSPQMERIIEDPNNFINEAETMLQSPTSPESLNLSTGNTPGVIGAQEVYRDPRQRMLAEQKQNTAPRVPGPEKLSFKEKMKMFAMETGEDSTPRDKVKISRAQRDIDNINSPNNNNNNTSVNNN